MISKHDPRDLPGRPAPSQQAANTSLLLMDIGNTNVGLATWHDGARAQAVHVPNQSVTPIAERARQLWEGLPAARPRLVLVSSVYPAMLARLRPELVSRGIDPLLVVGEDIPLPIPADVPEPEKVGTDRICAAAGAFAKVGCACVVADFGTALTIDLVADNNVFMGGTILPGMGMSARALHEYTALLPQVEIGTPTETLGKNTVSAIRNGIFAMMVGALREITERYATDIGKWPILVATGGDAPAVASACEFVDHVIPDLCLDGLVIAYRNAVARFIDDDDDD